MLGAALCGALVLAACSSAASGGGDEPSADGAGSTSVSTQVEESSVPPESEPAESSASDEPAPTSDEPAPSSAETDDGEAASGAPTGTEPVSAPDGEVPKLVLGPNGIPPTIPSLLPYIADQKGFYEAFGVDVEIKQFKVGADAVRALSTGQIDIAIAPAAQHVQLAAQGTDLVAVQGQERPDWVIVSADPAVDSCEKLKGTSLGVEAIGGIRYQALSQMLKTCGLTIEDVHPLVFPGNQNPQAMVAGQLKQSVLHLNEQSQVEDQGIDLTTVMTMAEAVPNTMYTTYAVQKDKLETLRPALVRFVAAQIATLNWMFDPANADEVATLGEVTGSDATVMKDAMARYHEIGFWDLTGPGLVEQNYANLIKGLVSTGNFPEDQAPAPADLIDLSVYQDAQKLVKP